MATSTIIQNLIQSARQIDPVLADTLVAIARELDRITNVIDPAPVVQKKVGAPKLAAPDPVTSFTYSFTDTNLVLSWIAPSSDILLYEIRKGSSWTTADRITITGNLSAILDPLTVGTHTYLIKSLNSSGIYSVDATSVSVIVPSIGTINITSNQIDQNVLLYWTAPTSTFRISHYVLTKDGVSIGTSNTTFTSVFENVGGTFVYGITAVDIVGNTNTEVTVSITLPDPADFLFKNQFTSNLSGTKTNAVLDTSADPDALIVCINTTETYQNHFVTRAWTSPQDQVNAGYTRWLSPDQTTASYKETFDCGSIYSNTIIGISWSTSVITGAFTIGVSTRVSDDGISWSAPNTNSSFFVTSVRYIEVTVNMTGGDDKALMHFFNLQVNVKVKNEIDSGSVSAVAGDVNGTTVTFNKTFKDVDSITVSVKSTTEQFIAIYRFNDVPNPTNFSVFVYDTSGIRVSKTVEWKARGIV